MKLLDRWRERVLARDGHACQFCGGNKRLSAHHVHCKKKYPELRLVPENGLALCASCHMQYHSLYQPPFLGRHHSPETRRAIGVLHKGNKYKLGYMLPMGARQRIGKANKGNKYCVGRSMSPETRRKIGEANKGNKSRLGKTFSPEVRAKISESNKKTWAEKRRIPTNGP